MASIRIVHTREQGTLVEGTARGDGSNIPLKAAGFRWSGQLGAWYIRGSRDRRADRFRIDQAVQLLTAAGFEVDVEVDDVEHRDIAEVEAQKAARVADRADALAEKAWKARDRSEELEARSRAIAERRPFGQPILVGHHSERAHRRDIDRMHTLDRKSIDEYRRSNELANAAKSAAGYESARNHIPTTLRRIKKLTADRDRWQRGLAQAERNDADSDYVQLARTAIEELDRQITHWQGVVDQAQAAGVKVWGPDDFTVGGFALFRGKWFEVLRVNAKSITIPAMIHSGTVITKANADLSWNDRIAYDDLSGSATQDELARMLAGTKDAEPAG